MPVDTEHPSYIEWKMDWKKIRDVLGGERKIKAGRQEYLPKLDGQSILEYDAYLERGVFFDATMRTQDGLLGAIFRKPPDIEIPEAFDEVLFNADLAGTPLKAFAKGVTGEVIAMGRYGVLVDALPEGTDRRAFLSGYPTEAIISWRETSIEGRKVLTLVVLREVALVPTESDFFELREREQFRVLALGPVNTEQGDFSDPVYSVTLFERQKTERGTEQLVAYPTIVPLRAGVPLDFIPFQFLGPRELKPTIQKPPLLGLVEVNIGHWHTTVDWKHGAHFTALPTLFVTGDVPSDFDLTIGPSTGLQLPEGANAGILEYKGDGLGSLERMREAEKKDMAVLGARLLEDPKSAVESGVAVGMRHRGENSMLASIADTLSLGLTKALNWMVWWSGGPEEGSRISLNKDFFDAPLSAEGVVKLVTAWQNQGLGGEALWWNLKQGERLPEDMTFEKFQQDIEENGPAAIFLGTDDDLEDEDEDEIE